MLKFKSHTMAPVPACTMAGTTWRMYDGAGSEGANLAARRLMGDAGARLLSIRTYNLRTVRTVGRLARTVRVAISLISNRSSLPSTSCASWLPLRPNADASHPKIPGETSTWSRAIFIGSVFCTSKKAQTQPNNSRSRYQIYFLANK